MRLFVPQKVEQRLYTPQPLPKKFVCCRSGQPKIQRSSHSVHISRYKILYIMVIFRNASYTWILPTNFLVVDKMLERVTELLRQRVRGLPTSNVLIYACFLNA